MLQIRGAMIINILLIKNHHTNSSCGAWEIYLKQMDPLCMNLKIIEIKNENSVNPHVFLDIQHFIQIFY